MRCFYIITKLQHKFPNTDAIDERKNKLSQWEKAQQYLFDANEAEAWMSEQELYMMVEDRGKDEISAQNLMKKHEILEQAVDDYAHTIRQLGETVRHLTADEHPLRSVLFSKMLISKPKCMM